MNRAAAAVALLLFAASASAQQRAIPLSEVKSGTAFLGADLRSLQNDEFANPGTLWVERGEKLWREPAGKKNQSCAGCHTDAAASMRGVAAHYPKIDKASGKLLNLEGRINACRIDHQGAEPLRYESEELLGLTAYVARQSRGLPIDVKVDNRLRPFLDSGRGTWERRQGQLNLACTNCHDDHWGRRLAGSVIPQAHPTGYPLYRLEWQSLGSLERRLRNCLIGMRAEPYAFGAPEMVDLTLFLMWRARGMPLESPAVRP